MTIRNDHPRDDLIRMVPVSSEALIRADDSDNGNGDRLVGTPIVFNQWTEIAGWEGNFMERLATGAATKTLKERKDQIKVLFNHGFDPQIGDKPLGKPEVMEPRDNDVWTETPLADTSYNKDIKELLSVGAIDGMSFRFTVQRDEWNEEPDPSPYNPKGLPERTIKEIKLYEFGPVTFPAYEATTAGVRARDAYLAYRQAKQTENREPTAEPDNTTDDLDPITDPVVVEVPPTLDVLEDSPIGDREALAPDATPPEDEPDDTPDMFHLSEPALARMRRQTESMRDYWELVLRSRT